MAAARASYPRAAGPYTSVAEGGAREQEPTEPSTLFETFGKAKRAGSEIMTGFEIGAPIGARPDVGGIREEVEWLS